MLLLAESRALFTVYRTITDTGMRIYQLNRDSQQDITSPPDEVGPLPSMRVQASEAMCAACDLVSKIAILCPFSHSV